MSNSNYTSYTPNGYVYFVQQIETGFVKIGYAKNYRERFHGLQTAQPQTLIIRLVFSCIGEGYNARVEKAFHDHFKSKRIAKSHEWFVLSEDEITDLITLIQVARSSGLPGEMLKLDEFFLREPASELPLYGGYSLLACRVESIKSFYLREREDLIMENIKLRQRVGDLEFKRKSVELIIFLFAIITIFHELVWLLMLLGA